ncbi:hypothetical protein L3X38_015560 [Prunus dulcis]|uniref:Uncharacterized protein n=1 Tax=Prunus dulcis TaxID=3755 RepID=A0AAD4Z8X9_PRUDU|nr:hypothetical protein L3X38_015560 [Prunus dulcis]
MRISVRWSNDIRIEIREFLRARDHLRISSGYIAASPDSPTRRHTRRQRVGVQSNFRRRKNSTPEVTLPTLASTRGGETIPQSPSLGGGGGGATAEQFRFEPVERAAGVRGFRRGKRAELDRGVEASQTGPVSGPAVAGTERTEEREG